MTMLNALNIRRRRKATPTIFYLFLRYNLISLIFPDDMVHCTHVNHSGVRFNTWNGNSIMFYSVPLKVTELAAAPFSKPLTFS